MDVSAIMRKTRIALYLSTEPRWGGSHQYAQAIVSALASLDPRKFDIRVRDASDCWKPFLENTFASKFDYNLPQFFSKYTIKLLWYRLTHTKKIPSIIEKQKLYNFGKWSPHICITPQMHGFPPNDLQTKHLGVIHDLMHRYEAQFPEVGTKEEIESRETYFTKLLADGHTILVDSHVGKQHVHECYSTVNANIEVLPFTVFKEQMPAHSQAPKIQLPEKFFFYPAQFWEHKNHKRLAEALRICINQNSEKDSKESPKECADMHFVLTGGIDKNGYDVFQKYIQECNLEKHVSILGYVKAEEIVWLYENAQALVMPTFFGPTNIPPLEAFSKGCPVAISDIYGHREECGDAAIYFDPKSVQSIADVLTQLWTDEELHAILSEKGLERAKAWTEDDFKKRFLDIIYKIGTNN